MTKRELRFFDVAKSVAKTSEYPRIKIGCCIVKRTKILTVGVNLLKSHPAQKRFNKYRGIDTNKIYNNIHAELDAILKVANKNELEGSDIYLYREDVSGIMKMSKPCPACTHMLREYGIKNIYYTDKNKYYKERL